MATALNATTAFIGQLLAPLPIEAAQAADKKFCRALIADMKLVWQRVYWRYKSETYAELAEDLHRSAEGLKRPKYPFYDVRATARWRAAHQLMCTPATTMAAVKDKRDMLGYGGGHSDWQSLIDADLVRLRALGVKGA